MKICAKFIFIINTAPILHTPQLLAPIPNERGALESCYLSDMFPKCNNLGEDTSVLQTN